MLCNAEALYRCRKRVVQLIIRTRLLKVLQMIIRKSVLPNTIQIIKKFFLLLLLVYCQESLVPLISLRRLASLLNKIIFKVKLSAPLGEKIMHPTRIEILNLQEI